MTGAHGPDRRSTSAFRHGSPPGSRSCGLPSEHARPPPATSPPRPASGGAGCAAPGFHLGARHGAARRHHRASDRAGVVRGHNPEPVPGERPDPGQGRPGLLPSSPGRPVRSGCTGSPRASTSPPASPTIPVLLAKLWSVVPRLFALPPARSLAHALERISLHCSSAARRLFEFTGVLNVQLDCLPGLLLPAALLRRDGCSSPRSSRTVLKAPTACGTCGLGARRRPGQPAPRRATVSRRGAPVASAAARCCCS